MMQNKMSPMNRLQQAWWGLTRIRDHRGRRVAPVDLREISKKLREESLERQRPEDRRGRVMAFVMRVVVWVGLTLFATIVAAVGAELLRRAGWPVAIRFFGAAPLPPVAYMIVMFGIVLIVLHIMRPRRLYAVWAADHLIRSALSCGRCASCGHGIGGMPADAEGFIVCAECGASWRANDVDDGSAGQWAATLADALESSGGAKSGDDR